MRLSRGGRTSSWRLYTNLHECGGGTEHQGGASIAILSIRRTTAKRSSSNLGRSTCASTSDGQAETATLRKTDVVLNGGLPRVDISSTHAAIRGGTKRNR